jgi:deoxycytidylate deaminase
VSRLETKLIEQAFLLLPHCDPNNNFQHFSFLVRRTKILSIGINSNRSHTAAKKFGHYMNNIHSELSAIVHFPKSQDITRCTLYNVRILKSDNSIAMSKPCKHCKKLIYAFGIKKVLYTNYQGNFEVWDQGT